MLNQQTPSDRTSTLIRRILAADGEAIGCEDCFELIDRCAELVRAGRPIEEIYPQVKKHLDDCTCCSEEFKALLVALGALDAHVEEPPSN